MKNIYSVTVKFQDEITVGYDKYMVEASCFKEALEKAMKEFYKSENSYEKELIGTKVEKMKILK